MGDPERPGDGDEDDGFVVPSAPSSVRLVRRYAVTATTELGWVDVVDTVALLVSEVATNAVLHAYGPHVRVRVLDLGTRLRVEVLDGSPVLPTQRRAASSAEDGRGLALVEALAVQWGVEARPSGKTIWFEVT